jgi:uncharacterized Zn finger protein
MSWYSYGGWPPYVPVAERRRKAARKVAKLKKAGQKISPIEIAGRKITVTFWGDAWCKNLESYSDYANRLPRGRTYVRNGSVVDLRIEAGRVRALVSGSDIYTVDIRIKRLAKTRWTGIKGQCAGKIDSLVELLQGSISKGVMKNVTRKEKGLFPAPREISVSCSCPDWAIMCKHVAATLYGVGARLDHEPELLFTLRGVDAAEMVEAAIAQPPPGSKSRKGRRLKSDELSSVFGIDIDTGEESAKDASAPAGRGRRAVRTTKKRAKRATAANKPTAKKSSVKKKKAKKKKGTATKKAAAKRASGSATHRATKKTTVKAAASKKKPTSRKSGTRKAGKKARARETPEEDTL